MDLLGMAKAKGISQDRILEVINQSPGLNNLLRNLNLAGLSVTQLGQLLGITKQAISYRIGVTDKRVKDYYHEPVPIEDLKLEFWRMALADPTYWNKKGRIKKNVIIKFLQSKNYKRRLAESSYKYLNPDKMFIILYAHYHLFTPTEQLAWFRTQLQETHSIKEIYRRIKGNIPLTYITVYRYYKSLEDSHGQ